MKFIRKALWPTAIVAAFLMLFGALGSAVNADRSRATGCWRQTSSGWWCGLRRGADNEGPRSQVVVDAEAKADADGQPLMDAPRLPQPQRRPCLTRRPLTTDRAARDSCDQQSRCRRDDIKPPPLRRRLQRPADRSSTATLLSLLPATDGDVAHRLPSDGIDGNRRGDTSTRWSTSRSSTVVTDGSHDARGRTGPDARRTCPDGGHVTALLAGGPKAPWALNWTHRVVAHDYTVTR